MYRLSASLLWYDLLALGGVALFVSPALHAAPWLLLCVSVLHVLMPGTITLEAFGATYTTLALPIISSDSSSFCGGGSSSNSDSSTTCVHLSQLTCTPLLLPTQHSPP
jgi:hypothetical protein